MRIAIFASAFHPSLGGVEELCRQLALELMRQGHGVIVLTNRWPRDLPATASIDGISVYRLPFRLPEGSAKAAINYHLTHRRVEQDMLAILRSHHIDLLNVHCVSANAHYAMIAQEKLGLPLVVTLHGELTMDANQVFQKSARARGILRSALRRADGISACSQRTLQDAEAFFGEAFGEKARVIRNCIDHSEFDVAAPHRHPRPYIFALGRLVKEKGFDILLQAFAGGLRATHDLIIAGSGPEHDPLNALVRGLGLTGCVHFPGRADHAAVVRFMKGCQFFVLPSRADEGLPVVCLEAMGAGCAIVASRSGGVAEAVLDGQTGLLVDKENVEQLAAAMQRLAAAPALRARMAMAGKARSFDFARPRVAKQYLDAYATAAAPPQ